MLTLEQFEARIEVVKRQGFTEAEAGDIVAAIGDAIEVDELGRWVARDHDTGKILARIVPLD